MTDTFYFAVGLVLVTAILFGVDWLRGRRQDAHDNAYLATRYRQLDTEHLIDQVDRKASKRGPAGFEAMGERRRQQLQNAAKSGTRNVS